ncbi:MAG: GspH/FimT family pseudopilin [Rubrivivax sp.]|jgi:type IV fimbrial biogenesis protein FimT|nr:GspH/FimT family pseudopilin [Rubrivivax sp.]
MPAPRTAHGLTLVELMVGLAIAALLALAAAPFFGDYLANARLREGGHVLYAEALAAQSEAIKRNRTIRLESEGATLRLVDVTDPADPVLLREQALPQGLSAGSVAIDFGSEGRPAPFPTAGAIDISMDGITCSGDRRCPGLRVDAGGSVRLCGDKTQCG